MKVFVYGGSEKLGEHILQQLDEKRHEAVTIAETDNRAEALEQIDEVEVIIGGRTVSKRHSITSMPSSI